MSIKPDPVFEKEYNCLSTDLVGGLPPDGTQDEGSKMYVWNAATKELDSIFKKVFGGWYKI